MDVKLNDRRIRAKQRLEKQLKNGKKPALVNTPSGSSVWQDVLLTESDVKRITKELDILKSRIENLS